MPEDFLADQFEENRAHLTRVAYRMLGSTPEADDAVQEAWLRLSRSESSEIDNLPGWLTTVTARICLNMLRSRATRREDEWDGHLPDPIITREGDPSDEAELADSVGLALLVVLDKLEPAERLAFVLHDLFGVPFDEIGSILGRSPAAAKQIASRARRRVRGAPAPPDAGSDRHREVVEAFLRAARAGDLEGLLAVLDPDAVLHIEAAARTDAPAAEAGKPQELRGAATWARQFIAFSRLQRFVQPAVIDGSVGVILAPGGTLSKALTFTVANGKVARIEVIGDPARLRRLDIVVP